MHMGRYSVNGMVLCVYKCAKPSWVLFETRASVLISLTILSHINTCI